MEMTWSRVSVVVYRWAPRSAQGFRSNGVGGAVRVGLDEGGSIDDAFVM